MVPSSFWWRWQADAANRDRGHGQTIDDRSLALSGDRYRTRGSSTESSLKPKLRREDLKGLSDFELVETPETAPGLNQSPDSVDGVGFPKLVLHAQMRMLHMVFGIHRHG